MLPADFYQRCDAVEIARDLLGKELVVHGADGHRAAGLIVEVEAYKGATDRACHSYNYRRTPRTETMFKAGGVAYVYRSYGIHWLLNVVTNTEGEPDAVLIRGLEPTDGLEHMAHRRWLDQNNARLAAGPGALTVALGVKQAHNGLPFTLPQFQIRDIGVHYADMEINVGTRVGVASAGADALLPWRLSVHGSRSVSKARGVTEQDLAKLAARRDA
jgi:DNA-3-methyladenine glycosylase